MTEPELISSNNSNLVLFLSSINIKPKSSKDFMTCLLCINDPNMNIYNDISELPEHRMNEIKHFFTVYKQLENKETVIQEVLGVDAAKEIIKNAINAYNDLYIK